MQEDQTPIIAINIVHYIINTAYDVRDSGMDFDTSSLWKWVDCKVELVKQLSGKQCCCIKPLNMLCGVCLLKCHYIDGQNQIATWQALCAEKKTQFQFSHYVAAHLAELEIIIESIKRDANADITPRQIRVLFDEFDASKNEKHVDLAEEYIYYSRKLLS